MLLKTRTPPTLTYNQSFYNNVFHIYDAQDWDMHEKALQLLSHFEEMN